MTCLDIIHIMFKDHDTFYDPSIVHIQRVTVWRPPLDKGTGDNLDDVNVVLSIYSLKPLDFDHNRITHTENVLGVLRTDLTIPLRELVDIVNHGSTPADKSFESYLETMVVALIYGNDTETMPPKNSLAQTQYTLNGAPFDIDMYLRDKPLIKNKAPKKEDKPLPQPKITKRPKLG